MAIVEKTLGVGTGTGIFSGDEDSPPGTEAFLLGPVEYMGISVSRRFVMCIRGRLALVEDCLTGSGIRVVRKISTHAISGKPPEDPWDTH